MKAKIYNFKTWINNTNPEVLSKELKQLLEQSKFNILDFMDYKFKPQGYTGIWLIAESHLAVHTFPEENKTYIELSSCNEIKQKNFVKLFNSKFK